MEYRLFAKLYIPSAKLHIMYVKFPTSTPKLHSHGC
jgi:hypothetical protein